MKRRKRVRGPLRKYLVDGMREKGHNAAEVAAAIDRWNDGSQPNGLFDRAIFQAIQDIFVDMGKYRKGLN